MSAPGVDHPVLRLWADTMAMSRENFSEPPKLRAETRVRLFGHALEAEDHALVHRQPLREALQDARATLADGEPDAFESLDALVRAVEAAIA